MPKDTNLHEEDLLKPEEPIKPELNINSPLSAAREAVSAIKKTNDKNSQAEKLQAIKDEVERENPQALVVAQAMLQLSKSLQQTNEESRNWLSKLNCRLDGVIVSVDSCH